MKLSPERLLAHLGKGVNPLYVLTGDEPLLIAEALDAIREHAAREGCGEREGHVAERSFDWDAFGADLQNMSLFATRRLVELRLPTGKPGEAGARFLTALAARQETGNVVVIVLPALDSTTARSRWAAALAEAAIWVECRPPRRDQLAGWLRQRLQKAGISTDEESLDVLASRVEGNLLAAKQEIDKLALMSGDRVVTAAVVRDSVTDGARFDVFQLSDAALDGDIGRTVRVLQGLEREGEAAALVLWALVRDVLSLADIVVRVHQGMSSDRAMADAGIWRNRQESFRRASRGRGLDAVKRLVRCAARADQIVKGARPGEPWSALLELSLELGGAAAPLAETA
jgi:DNA polymerase-3 subunit delta